MHPLFAHALLRSSVFESWNLNSEIQINAITEGVSSDALGTLQYFSHILNRHAQQLKDSIRALCKLAERSSQASNGVQAETLMPQAALACRKARRLSSASDVASNLGSAAPTVLLPEGSLGRL